MVPSKQRRKGSDEDVYVEETYIFTYDPNDDSSQNSSSPVKRTQTKQANSLSQLSHNLTEIKKKFLLKVEVYDEEESDDEDHDWL